MQESNNPRNRAVRSIWTRAVLAGAALIVVLAVWMYYELALSVPQAEAGPMPTGVSLPEQLAGFRPDAWFLPDDELLGFVEIPAGPFLMGSDPAVDPLAFDNEFWAEGESRGTVDLPAYLIARYEVTVAQFGAFVSATGYPVDEQTLAGPPDHPVVAVSWTDALAYSRWLEDTLRESTRTPAPLRELLRNGWHITLPSEAEWEKAARGTDGRIFPWGNEPRGDLANFDGRSPTPVGNSDCTECAFGLSDMSGNVWEWTRSPYTSQLSDSPDDKVDLEVDALWVMRGGSYGDGIRNVRTAIRGGADPGARRPFIGFRLVLTG